MFSDISNKGPRLLTHKKLSTQWFEVEEHLPEGGCLYWTYSEVFGSYQAAGFSPVRGWVNQSGNYLKAIMHWCALVLPQPFEILDRFNETIAKKYGIEKSMYD